MDSIKYDKPKNDAKEYFYLALVMIKDQSALAIAFKGVKSKASISFWAFILTIILVVLICWLSVVSHYNISATDRSTISQTNIKLYIIY